MKHELKTWPAYFRQVKDGSKTFELRKFDRKFEIGDLLNLKEYRLTDPSNPEAPGEYTGEELTVIVTSVLSGIEGQFFGLDKDHCIMSIKPF